MPKSEFLVLGIISGLLLVNINEGSCKDTGKQAPQRDTGEVAKTSLNPKRIHKVEQLDIKEKYGIDFSQLKKKTPNEIFQFIEKVMNEQKTFTPTNNNEKIIMDKIDRDSSGKIERLLIHFHRAYKGISIYNTKRVLQVQADNKIPLYQTPSCNDINISIKPSISKEQAFETAKKYLIENGKALKLPGDDGGFFLYTLPQELPETDRTDSLERIKRKMKEDNHLNALKLLQGCDLSKIDTFSISKISADGKTYLNIYSKSNKTHIKIKEFPEKIELKDSVELFIFPTTNKDSTVNYHLAGKLYLITLPDGSKLCNRTWGFWIDMQTGNIIDCYKNWKSDS